MAETNLVKYWSLLVGVGGWVHEGSLYDSLLCVRGGNTTAGLLIVQH